MANSKLKQGKVQDEPEIYGAGKQRSTQRMRQQCKKQQQQQNPNKETTALKGLPLATKETI